MNRINHLPWLLVLLFLLSAANLVANNLTVSNVTITGQNTNDDYVLVQFDISWENSFRDATNWDAAWVFVKYKTTDGVWHHATLNTTGFTAPTGSTISVEDNVGAFIYRDADGTGTFSKTGVQLRWNYGTDVVGDSEIITIKVFAFEMIYVPTASYELGDGLAGYRFYELVGGGNVNSVLINTSLVLVESYNGNVSGDDAQLDSPGIGIDGDGGLDNDNDGSIDNADYPTGYTKFYCMKYEITQEQYVDFLNTLTRAQQDSRTETDLSSGTTSVTNRYVMSNTSTMSNRNGIRIDASIHTSDPLTFYCDFDGDGTGGESNDGQNIACNFLSWADGAAYGDWAGLRPMTELEFEKACRGDQSAVGEEYAWGTADRATDAYTLSGEGEASEGIATNYSTTASVGNLSVTATDGTINGPLRVGIFAGNASNSGRVTSGATYYGIMEMSGNLREHVVTLGNSTGRSFTGLHGDGDLDVNGDADVTNWPGTNSTGSGFRGGSWALNANYPIISYRNNAVSGNNSRNNQFGFHLVRTAN